MAKKSDPTGSKSGQKVSYVDAKKATTKNSAARAAASKGSAKTSKAKSSEKS